ncbi:hypothetical protein At1D1609_52750 (plasmid) [Agrobacterium tumefaciens]|uniref:Uncharacterized protein n=1 Tax=Agrobacterium tumefaciens TaxID=358 RepID=A0A2L2LM46_AGRTU|nr:hypothetical protein At1D1609_52750 [Agrobacterium tumefaciens]
MVSASQSYRLLLGRPAAGSPLLADPRALLLSFGTTEMGIRYSGGSLARADPVIDESIVK